MSWRRLLGRVKGSATEAAEEVRPPRHAGVRVVPLRTLGPEPVAADRGGSRSELRLLAPRVPFRSSGTCLVVAGALSCEAFGHAAARDLLAGSGAPPLTAGPAGAIVLTESPGPADGSPFERIVGEAGGEGFVGVTGLRVLFRRSGLSALRLGPPPGARWAITGLHALALFHGRLTVIDGGESVDALAWEAVLVTDPSVTLHLVAGNDSLRAVAFAAADVHVALG